MYCPIFFHKIQGIDHVFFLSVKNAFKPRIKTRVNFMNIVPEWRGYKGYPTFTSRPRVLALLNFHAIWMICVFLYVDSDFNKKR